MHKVDYLVHALRSEDLEDVNISQLWHFSECSASIANTAGWLDCTNCTSTQATDAFAAFHANKSSAVLRHWQAEAGVCTYYRVARVSFHQASKLVFPPLDGYEMEAHYMLDIFPHDLSAHVIHKPVRPTVLPIWFCQDLTFKPVQQCTCLV